MPEKSYLSFMSGPGRSILKEDAWLKHIDELLNAESEQVASFHSTCEVQMTDVPAITAMLQLFHEKTHTSAMIKHSKWTSYHL